MVFFILQSFLDSDYLCENKIEVLCNGIFDDILSLKKDILVFPFLESLIISILSICNFSNYLNSDKIFEAFKHLSYNSYNKIHQMDLFPSSSNELPLIFSLYSTLIQTSNDENTIKDKSLLFDKYKSLNNELFNVIDEKDQEFVEGSFINNKNQKKKKNHSLLYILYYYSILLYNKDHLPYPKFLFVHDLIRQHFGGFRTVITQKDIKKFEEKKQNGIIYKSDVFNNDKDLFCSFKLINKQTNQGRSMNMSSLLDQILSIFLDSPFEFYIQYSQN